jgi:uridine kinase
MLPRHKRKRPLIVAIVGGSGAGKSWLADKLTAALAPDAAGLSLDDFYRDRSHLSEARRARLNFDHPRAIDWAALEKALRRCLAGFPTALPCYDFASHCRLRKVRILKPKPIVIVEGLWLLRRPAIRRLFGFRVFLECPVRIRLRRRLDRDRRSRGRTGSSVKNQFWSTVEPMHERHVAPQSKFADLVLSGRPSSRDVARLARLLRRKSVEIRTAHLSVGVLRQSP